MSNQRRRLVAALLACTFGWAFMTARGAPPPRALAAAQRGHLFPPADLGLLEAPDREQWQKPDQIMDALGVADGSVVADLGAGGGWFTVHLARRVGPNGRVYAEDIQRQMLEAIERRVARERLTNVTTVLGTPTDPRLPTPVDAVLIVDAYREMRMTPENVVQLLRNVARLLKPQGRVGVVDFTTGGGGPGPDPEDRVDPDVVIRDAAAAGLQLVDRQLVEPFQYLLVFGKASARPTS